MTPEEAIRVFMSMKIREDKDTAETIFWDIQLFQCFPFIFCYYHYFIVHIGSYTEIYHEVTVPAKKA